MARRSAAESGGERPILPFTKPVKRTKISAEIKA